MHIAIIRLSSMGDIIIQSSFISWIKYINPGVRIRFITLQNFKGLLDDHPHIDEIVYLERKQGLEDIKNLRRLARDLNENCDLIFDLHGTLRSAIIRLFSWRVMSIKTYKRSFYRWLLVRFKMDKLKSVSSQHSRTMEDFSFLWDIGFDYDEAVDFIKKETGRKTIGLTSVGLSYRPVTKKKNIVLSPVASFQSKRWPMMQVKHLIKEILNRPEYSQYNIVLLAGPGDTYIQEALDEEILTNTRFENFQGKTSLDETVIKINESEVCITNDTGSGHIAEALGVPVIAIFGATSESFGFRTHLKSSISVSASNISCRPCSTTGKKDCFQKSHLCMESVSVSSVLENLEKTLTEKVDGF